MSNCFPSPDAGKGILRMDGNENIIIYPYCRRIAVGLAGGKKWKSHCRSNITLQRMFVYLSVSSTASSIRNWLWKRHAHTTGAYQLCAECEIFSERWRHRQLDNWRIVHYLIFVSCETHSKHQCRNQGLSRPESRITKTDHRKLSTAILRYSSSTIMHFITWKRHYGHRQTHGNEANEAIIESRNRWSLLTIMKLNYATSSVLCIRRRFPDWIALVMRFTFYFELRPRAFASRRSEKDPIQTTTWETAKTEEYLWYKVVHIKV